MINFYPYTPYVSRAFKVITFSVKSILIINFSFYQWAKINKKNITHMLLCKKITTIIVKKYDA